MKKTICFIVLTLLTVIDIWVTGDGGVLTQLAAKTYDAGYVQVLVLWDILGPILFGGCICGALKGKEKKTDRMEEALFLALHVLLAVIVAVSRTDINMYNLISLGVLGVTFVQGILLDRKVRS